MRILATADIHGVLSVYEWLATLLREQPADLLILAGDLLLGGWDNEQSEQASRDIVPLLKRMPNPVLYLMGNDDYVSLDYEDEQIKPLHGRRLDFGGYSFVGYQYSPQFSGGIHEKLEGEIEMDLRRLEPMLGEQTVLVTHSPACGVLDRVYGGEHVGSPALASLLLRRPVMAHIHGHIHHSCGREGYHFNVAAAGQRRCVAVDLPTLSCEILTGD
jgi:Icc-related predicted phosphoesterase